jgi:hypothetical protein
MMIKTNLFRIPFNLMVAMIFMSIDSDTRQCENVHMFYATLFSPREINLIDDL